MLIKEDKTFFCNLTLTALTFLVIALGDAEDRSSWFNCYITTKADILKLAEEDIE